MESKERVFLTELYKDYYRRRDPDYPYLIEKREFGMGFEKKIDFRHKHFSSNRDLKTYLMNNGPLYISYSVAYYRHPEARPMEAKIMEGSDLVFDIDVHGCPYHEDNFVCDNCLGTAKEDVIYLIEEFLEPDLGIPKSALSINFSGNRGYHIHVDDERYRDLDVRSRRELVDYLTGVGFDSTIPCEKHPSKTTPGWLGRITRCLIKKLDERKIRSSKRDTYLSQLESGIWAGVCKSSWYHREVESCIAQLAANVDGQVTSDIYRLIRLPGSIHGGSSLVATKVYKIESFNPLKHAVWIDNEPLEVYVEYAPPMIMKDEEFPEIKHKKTILPKYYAAYLISKGVARLV